MISKKNISIFLVSAGFLLTVFCCLFQFRYFHTIRRISIRDIPSIDVDYNIDDIRWRNSDYDYIVGKLSKDDKPITKYPTEIIFYLDGDDTAYAMHVKMRNYIEPEREDRYFEEKDIRGFMYPDKEYLTNAGEKSEESEFYCLIKRNNTLRRTYKIGFLIETEDGRRLFKTDETYKYYGID